MTNNNASSVDSDLNIENLNDRQHKPNFKNRYSETKQISENRKCSKPQTIFLKPV